MPSTLHEILIEMFRGRPALAVEVLDRALGLSVPEHESIRVEPGEFPDIAPTEYRADVVVVLAGATGPVLAVVVEVQLGRDRVKRWSWPVYLTSLRARLRCSTLLMVVCVDPAVARWCAAPISLGHPGWTLIPLVLGPDRVPVVSEPIDAGRSPELAVLSALAHGGEPGGRSVLDALPHAFAAVDVERATLYSDIVFAALPAAAQRYLEVLMTTHAYEYKSDFVRRYVVQGRDEGREEGRVEGQATAVLAVLDARGIAVPEAARARIMACTDHDQLDTWVRRAAEATTIDAVFSAER